MAKFTTAIENDLATPQALSYVQVAIKDSELQASEIVTIVRKMDEVLGLKIEDCAKEFNKKESAQVDTHEGDPEAEEITALVLERTQAKKDKDFAKADQIRNDLQARGVIIIDTPNGPIWKRN